MSGESPRGRKIAAMAWSSANVPSNVLANMSTFLVKTSFNKEETNQRGPELITDTTQAERRRAKLHRALGNSAEAPRH